MVILILRVFFDWLAEVDILFEYTEFLEDRKVKFVAYKLKGRTSIWWDRLREMRMREGRTIRKKVIIDIYYVDLR